MIDEKAVSYSTASRSSNTTSVFCFFVVCFIWIYTTFFQGASARENRHNPSIKGAELDVSVFNFNFLFFFHSSSNHRKKYLWEESANINSCLCDGVCHEHLLLLPVHCPQNFFCYLCWADTTSRLSEEVWELSKQETIKRDN